MLVKDIAISEHVFHDDRDVHAANVTLSFADKVVRLRCHLQGLGPQDMAHCVPGLVKDALRQLRRMPEYRSGQSRIKFTRKLADMLSSYPGWHDHFRPVPQNATPRATATPARAA